MTTRTIHVSIGPVQDFIRQARRTRDLWAGSFLLSWLSGKAMLAATEKAGSIEKPNVTRDPMFLALSGRPEPDNDGRFPFIATLPNQFTATVPDTFDGTLFTCAVCQAWKKLADEVWKTFLEELVTQGRGNKTKDIWDRQIGNFWQVSWVFGDDHTLLNRRKSWRTGSLGTEEGGDHCTIMGDWQELSGHVRAKSGEREKQDGFWDAVRRQIDHHLYGKNTIGSIELRRSERLCAIALVKRLFPLLEPKILHEVIGWAPDRRADNGEIATDLRRRLRKYPSTAYMAAVPWLLHAWKHEEEETVCENFFKAVNEQAKKDNDWDIALLEKAEWHPRIKELVPAGRFAALDGTFFYHNGIARRRAELRGNAESSRPEDIQANIKDSVDTLTSALKELQNATAPRGSRRRRKMMEASPFYALLFMDGDSMGKLIKEIGGTAVSECLTPFADAVRGIVEDANGLTLYAGGDDVLALLPLTTALGTARGLSDRFRTAFRDRGHSATLSGAVVYAHYGTPLSAVIDTARTGLDDIAKEANGRDSLSVTVLKPGGVKAQWVSKWDLDEKTCAVKTVQDLVRAFADDDERSSSFLHHIGERYGDILSQLPPPQPGGRDDLIAFLVAERLKGKDVAHNQDIAAYEKAHREMTELAAVCRPRGTAHAGTGGAFVIDGAMLVKFLADNGGYPGGWDEESAS